MRGGKDPKECELGQISVACVLCEPQAMLSCGPLQMLSFAGCNLTMHALLELLHAGPVNLL